MVTVVHYTRCVIFQRKYRIKFDGKGMKVLVGMHTACMDPPTEVLPVGSRVIGQFTEAYLKPCMILFTIHLHVKSDFYSNLT